MMAESRTIEIRMTWATSLPLLLAILENGDHKGKEYARSELRRMAAALDHFSAATKAAESGEVLNDELG